MSDLNEKPFFITYTPEFKREYKRLAKKYVSLDSDMKLLIAQLEQEPTFGTALGNNVYKIRLAIASKNKGKSGGARVISYFLIKENELYLLFIYDKSEQSTISDSTLKLLIENIDSNKLNF